MIYVLFFHYGGVPQESLAPAIITYKKISDGTDVASPPAITAIGGGGYKFTATPTEDLFVVVDGGAGLLDIDRYKVLKITPHDADLDAAVSSRTTLGTGAITWTYTLTDADSPFEPITDADVWITSDVAGTDVIAAGKTDQSGVATFFLDQGQIYVWRQKSGWDFTNPDIEIVTP